ncbi:MULTISPECIES: LytR/AlgR family response regulator transcription factor [Sphingobacterium]|uniref:LytR/AlgR family response regulator transcription factor n=1 Tax=Sphingobacterium populi TaxID=1812824 RepID=A0ABW5UCB9_9SPHI|nr:LytTR family DNA-binding domain-containing protein [Sphingobacterium sp. CFCC 11742]
MRKYHTVIIDDQQASIDHLLDLSKHIDYIEIIGTFQDPFKAQSFLRRNRVDFIILDIELRNFDGFEFLSTLPNPRIPTILYTAHSKYEDRGYDLTLVDVLLKPVSSSRFKGALRRVNNELKDNLLPDSSLEELCDYFQVRGPGKFERQLVWYKNVLYIESIDNKVLIHQIGFDKPLVSNMPLRNIIDMLPRTWFLQCHKSYIFNINFFKKYHNKSVHLTVNKVQLPVGDRKVFKRFDHFLEDENKLC